MKKWKVKLTFAEWIFAWIYKFKLLIIWKYFLGRVYDIQGQKAIFLKKGFAEYSSVVVQFTKKINSIRDQIESNGGKAEATDVEIGQG